MIGDQLFDDIVTGFYSAASSDLPWVDALLPMQREMAAFLVHLHAIDVTLGGVGFSYEAGGVAPEGALDYIRTYHRIDPRANLLVSMLAKLRAAALEACQINLQTASGRKV